MESTHETRKPRGTFTVVLGTFGAGLAAFALLGTNLGHNLVVAAFGPPPVVMAEAYAEEASGVSFDHTKLDAVLKKHVDEAGLINYGGVRKDIEQLDGYIATLADAPLDEMGRDEKVALLINAYNAFTLKLIAEHYPSIDSIRDIPEAQRWKSVRWNVGGNTWSLDQIEHEQIRPNFKEPRIHFALVCAAIGCPPLRAEAYTAAKLEAQLADQTRYVHERDRWVRYDPANPGKIGLTKLYSWFAGDFEQAEGTVLDYVAQHVPTLDESKAAGNTPAITWLDYDWSLNAKESP